jgi:hypothetical protein
MFSGIPLGELAWLAAAIVARVQQFDNIVLIVV